MVEENEETLLQKWVRLRRRLNQPLVTGEVLVDDSPASQLENEGDRQPFVTKRKAGILVLVTCVVAAVIVVIVIVVTPNRSSTTDLPTRNDSGTPSPTRLPTRSPTTPPPTMPPTNESPTRIDLIRTPYPVVQTESPTTPPTTGPTTS